MPRPVRNMRNLVSVSDEEMWAEVRQAFAEPLLPEHPSLAADFKLVGPPAPASDLELLQSTCGGALPPAYLDFLRSSDGAAGCISDSDRDYLTLWPSKEVAARNAGLPQGQTWPGLLVVGSDGRGGVVGFDRGSADPESWPVVRIGPEGGDGERREIAPNFRAWQRGGFQLRPGGFVCGGG
jgi:hypothetical protein